MKKFIILLLNLIFCIAYGQNWMNSNSYFVGETAQQFLLKQQNDLIITNPSERIFFDNQTVYVEKDFERKYKPFATKHRVDSESFLAQAGGLVVYKSTLFLFEKGLESLLKPRTKRHKHTRLSADSSLEKRKAKGINP